MATFDHAGRKCPSCRAELGKSTSIGHEGPPRKGLMSVCAYCAVVLVYDSPASFHAITAEEEMKLDDETSDKLSTLQSAVKAVMRQKGQKGGTAG